MSFDIHILPVSKKEGKDANDQIGVYLASPPTKAIRTRKTDVVLFYLTMANTRNFPQNKQIHLFKKLASYYFEAKESISTSLTKMMDEVNRYFLNQNIKNEAYANFFTGHFTIAVFKENRLYVAQAGKAIGFVCDGEFFTQQHALSENVNLLGMKQGIEPFFYINEVNKNSSIILAHEISEGWDKNTFRDLGNQSLHIAQRRLVSETTDSANFIIIKPCEGKGFIQLIQGKTRTPIAEAMVKQNQEPEKLTKTDSQNAHENLNEKTAIHESAPNLTNSPTSIPEIKDEEMSEAVKSFNENKFRSKKDNAQQFKSLFLGTKNILDKTYQGVLKIFTPLKEFVGNLLPKEPLFTLPTTVKIFIAVLIPVVFSIIGSVIAISYGSEQVFIQKLAEANTQILIAENASDIEIRKTAYEEALLLIDDALSYGENEDALHKQLLINNTLDQMNQVTRIYYRNLLEISLPKDVIITKIISTDNDVFMLDQTSGEVLRVVRYAENKYQIASDFKCSNNDYNSERMNPIVDIAAYPMNSNAEPVIVAIDNKGIILYCYIGSNPTAKKLDLPPMGWGNTTDIEIKNNYLYILDKAANAVWFYSLEEARKPYDAVPAADLSPKFYFSDTMPLLKDVVDLTINEANLFALFPDQHLALCEYKSDYGTEGFQTITDCSEPAIFNDTRLASPETPYITDAIFNQIGSTPAPEPSVFFADFSNHHVYQFSQKLKLINIYKPMDSILQDRATAFAVSPGYKPYRTMFLAFDNIVFYAIIE